jgi:hypothetical protein
MKVSFIHFSFTHLIRAERNPATQLLLSVAFFSLLIFKQALNFIN